MNDNYSEKLFTNYSRTHLAYLDSDEESKIEWFISYVRQNYLSYIDKFDRKSSKILDIGCNKGYLLLALNYLGFESLHGVDLSPDDLKRAKTILPIGNFLCIDAFDYLSENVGQFDVITLKAVLEHIPKNKILILLEHIKKAIRGDGMVIIDVPNMDWLFATHERYMDFTHEVGFTQESLRQVMNAVFRRVEIRPVDHIPSSSAIINLKKRVSRFFLNKLFSWADPQGAENLIWARSIIAVGRK
jgi:2-polyprenyl-3-methyl-5-hydroxy-6-metoxy-1,4-benzoquinol methylase